MNIYMDTLPISRPTLENVEPYLPPGYRFHPTDEELVVFYLGNKVSDCRFTVAAIAEVDLNKSEPWELPEKAKMGEKEWYFFSVKDRKYPTGLRTNRATEAGYWKATGKDREVMSSRHCCLVGMKKTLVFYKGRAPKGEKSNWIMHEYRLEGDSSIFHFPKATRDEWVVCRIFQKNTGGKKTPSDTDPQSSLPALLESPSTAAGAEDSGVTDSEASVLQRDRFSYLQKQYSGINQSSDIDMWLSRGSKDASAPARYPELPAFENGTSFLSYLRCTDPLSQDNLRAPQPLIGSSDKSLPLRSSRVGTPSMDMMVNPASGFVLKALLDQYSNSGRACKLKPHLQQTADPKLTNSFKFANNGALPVGDDHLQFETPVVASQSHAPINPDAIHQIAALSCLADVNGGVHSNSYDRMGRSTADQLPPHHDMENLWSY